MKRARRALAAGTAAAFALSVAWGGAAAASAVYLPSKVQPMAEQGVTGGSLEWGVRKSIRSYLEGHGHTGGSVAAYEGATYRTGDDHIAFPVESGRVDLNAGTASIAFAGEVEMLGFEDPWLHFDDVRLEVDGDTAEIVVDMLASYNVREKTNDITLATFDMPEEGLVASGDTVTLTTGEGAFPAEIGEDHLPSYGGPTYVGKNAYTDPLTLTLELGDIEDGSNPGDDTDGDTGDGGDGGDDGNGDTPDSGPYGTSVGTAYEGNSASMRVTPGYAVNADGDTEVTVEGFDFDPTGNVYVGLGTMTDPANPEDWRRSKGGASGPVGAADFTYGAPRYVSAHSAENSDVGDSIMDANGNWRYTMVIPGSEIASFFGDTIDCLAHQCGFFSFGAHGSTNAANEAYVPIYFDGQDESSWPDRDEEVPTPIPNPGGPDAPTDPKNPGDNTKPGEKTAPHGESIGKNSHGASLKVSPALSLADRGQVVQLEGSGYPTSTNGVTSSGIYVLFGWIDPEAGDSWGRGNGGTSGKTYTYAEDGNPAGTFQRAVNFPGGAFESGQPTMDANGNWTMDFTIESSRFTSAHGLEIDCYDMQCGVITIGAMTEINAEAEVFTPVHFHDTSDATGNQRPVSTAGDVTANPNMADAAGTGDAGALANTGSQTRALMFGGLLLVSLGLLSAALLWAGRRRITATISATEAALTKAPLTQASLTDRT